MRFKCWMADQCFDCLRRCQHTSLPAGRQRRSAAALSSSEAGSERGAGAAMLLLLCRIVIESKVVSQQQLLSIIAIRLFRIGPWQESSTEQTSEAHAWYEGSLV